MLNSPSKAFPLKSRGLPLQLEYSKIKATVNRVEHAKKHSLNDRLLQWSLDQIVDNITIKIMNIKPITSVNSNLWIVAKKIKN